MNKLKTNMENIYEIFPKDIHDIIDEYFDSILHYSNTIKIIKEYHSTYKSYMTAPMWRDSIYFKEPYYMFNHRGLTYPYIHTYGYIRIRNCKRLKKHVRFKLPKNY